MGVRLVIVVAVSILGNWGYAAHTSFGAKTSGILPANFPSEADTLAYVDALKHSNFSQWRSLEEVAKTAGGGSCSGAVNTSVLTALYLLGLFNLCSANPAACCVPELAKQRKKRNAKHDEKGGSLPPFLNTLTQNLSSLSLDQFQTHPSIPTPQGGRVPVHISVVEQVRKLWDSNPRLLSNLPCHSATEAVRASFISLSGVASGIILAYSIAQLNQCYPDQLLAQQERNKIWFFPIPAPTKEVPKEFLVQSLPPQMPVQGEDDPDSGCGRTSVRMTDGRCAKLMSSDLCPYMHWVLLNRDTQKGECVPRLCSPNKIFVEADQMCHNVDEPNFCPPSQRLYLTAWGEAVCDCKDAMFFGPDQKCHHVYDQAYCYKGAVLQFHKPSKTLVCKTDPCRKLNDMLPPGGLPYAYVNNDTCHQMGSAGPCDDSERLGFDIEFLEASCVSLEEAGLLQAPRSYTYSHMSFPSILDKSFPHYEVSYVILNGSTWELEMRTVGRRKRDLPDRPPSENRKVISFLDTREFPTQMSEVIARFQGLREADKGILINDGANRGVSVPVAEERDAALKMNKKLRRKRLRGIKRKNTNFQLPSERLRKLKELGRKRQTNAGNWYTRNRAKENQKKSKIKERNSELSANSTNINEIDSQTFVNHKNAGKIQHGVNYPQQTHDKENETQSNNSKSAGQIQDGVTDPKQPHGNEKQSEDSKIVLNAMEENSTDCKWHFSFYTKNSNQTLFNSTSIDISKHPSLAPFRIERQASNDTKEISELPKKVLNQEYMENSKTETGPGETSSKTYSGDKYSNATYKEEDKSFPYLKSVNISQENLKNETEQTPVESKRFGQKSKVPIKVHHMLDNLRKSKHVSEGYGNFEPTLKGPEYFKQNSEGSQKINKTLKVSEIVKQTFKRSSADHDSSSKPNTLNILSKNSKVTPEIITVYQTLNHSQPSGYITTQSFKSTDSWTEKIAGPPSSLSTTFNPLPTNLLTTTNSLPSSLPNTTISPFSRSVAKNHSKPFLDKENREKSLSLTGSLGNTETKNIKKSLAKKLGKTKGSIQNRRRHRKAYRRRRDRKNSFKKSRERRRRRKRRKKKSKQKKKKNKTNSKTNKHSKKKRKSSPRKIGRKNSSKKLNGNSKFRPTKETLPDYLRNRGRRQAGPKRGAKLDPGIINAPLLNQCRPGAKRDYNGHCRPKVIPAERVPLPRRRSRAKSFKPTPPRMKCKGGERLDFRGMCRATLRGLG